MRRLRNNTVPKGSWSRDGSPLFFSLMMTAPLNTKECTAEDKEEVKVRGLQVRGEGVPAVVLKLAEKSVSEFWAADSGSAWRHRLSTLLTWASTNFVPLITALPQLLHSYETTGARDPSCRSAAKVEIARKHGKRSSCRRLGDSPAASVEAGPLVLENDARGYAKHTHAWPCNN